MSKECISYASFVACRVNGKCFYHYYFWIIISFVIKLRIAECTNALISQITASHYEKRYSTQSQRRKSSEEDDGKEMHKIYFRVEKQKLYENIEK